ncbi:hypothetical protein TMEN_6651 [Trichophyton mentagrophytes]|nr:hypothetical protein TMEN_6651 [Trichophyton mentagrophytes]
MFSVPPSCKQTLGSLSTSIQHQISTRSMLHSNYRAFLRRHNHTDIKPNNIIIDREEDRKEVTIHRVQLADIEDSIMVPLNRNILGKAVGNRRWRSLRAHAEARANTPSDVFSSGIVTQGSSRGVDVQVIVLQHQLWYFGNNEYITVFLKHMGDENPWGTDVNIVERLG